MHKSMSGNRVGDRTRFAPTSESGRCGPSSKTSPLARSGPQLLLRAPFVFEVSDEVAGVILADRQHAAFGPRQGPSFVGVDFKRKKVEIE